MILRDFTNKPKIEIDEFNNSIKITWLVVGGYLYPYNNDIISPIGGIISNSDTGKDFIFSFESHENKDFIVFYFSSKDYTLKISDKIYFMFETNTIIPFQIVESSQKSKYQNLNFSKVEITQTELETFSCKKLLKWKIEYENKNKSIISEAKNFYWYNNDNYSLVVQSLASQYQELVKKYIENHIPLIERKTIAQINFESGSPTIVEKCYVYLMIDTTNNFYKIGISNKPKYREKTLQSDKPTIELLCCKSFPNRKTAEILEKTLHKFYESKRIRGEWFNLNEFEIKDILSILS